MVKCNDYRMLGAIWDSWDKGDISVENLKPEKRQKNFSDLYTCPPSPGLVLKKMLSQLSQAPILLISLNKTWDSAFFNYPSYPNIQKKSPKMVHVIAIKQNYPYLTLGQGFKVPTITFDGVEKKNYTLHNRKRVVTFSVMIRKTLYYLYS